MKLAAKTPVLFARIGWMKYYNGPQSGDEKPTGGGKYNKANLGHEVFNFHEISGQLFGYFQPQMRTQRIALERIVPGSQGDALEGVLVVFVATGRERGGQRVVGWYRSATVFRNPQSSPAPVRNGFNYFLLGKARDAVLLPTHLRSCLVPSGKGGFGQANICYLYEKGGKPKPISWVPPVLEFVSNYSNENLVTNPQAEAVPAAIYTIEEEAESAAGFQSNPLIRKAVELHAMGVATQEFESRKFDVKDVSKTKPFDLFCTKGNETKFVEVKGTQGRGSDIVLTSGEVRFIRKNKANCILCVVHGISISNTKKPKASSGTLDLSEPFDLDHGILKPIAFTFRRYKKASI